MRDDMGTLRNLRRAHLGAYAAGGGGKYIVFADPAVEAVLLANGVSSDGVGITLADAESVTSISTWFHANTEITRFDELEKFTGLTSIYGTNLTNGGAFYGCTDLISVALPPSVTIIHNGAFGGCSALTTLGDTKQIASIGNASFYGCTQLSIDIDMPNLIAVGHYALYGTGIKKILNLGSITEIPAANLFNTGVFYGCPNLTTAILPETLTTLGKSSFGGNPNLATVVCKANTPPTMTAICFNGSDNAIIYVPNDSVADYQSATNWATYASRIKAVSELPTDNPTLYDEIKEYL